MKSSNLLDELIALEHRRTQAWLDRDAEALAELLDEHYVEVNVLGRHSRQQVLTELFPKVALQELAMEEPHLFEAGSDAAILSYRCRERLLTGGQEIKAVCNVCAVYRRRGDGWRLLLWQITPVRT
jgi:hypothetical protein